MEAIEKAWKNGQPVWIPSFLKVDPGLPLQLIEYLVMRKTLPPTEPVHTKQTSYHRELFS